ncbi:MAG: hypothetical protein ACK5JM_01785 [Rhodoblastus sp.]
MDHTLAPYAKFSFPAEGFSHDVYRRGEGPAVVIVHENPGLHPLVIRFADRVAAAGMSVYLPSLFGEPGRPITPGYAMKSLAWTTFGMQRKFSVWSLNRSSPVVAWLRALARKAHEECGGPGVGALGMGPTGGLPLAMMGEPCVIAPVLSQPSLPYAMNAARRGASTPRRKKFFARKSASRTRGSP